MAKEKIDIPSLWVNFSVKLKDGTTVYHRIKMSHVSYKALIRTAKISSLTSGSNVKITRELFREILVQSLDFEDVTMRYSLK